MTDEEIKGFIYEIIRMNSLFDPFVILGSHNNHQ
jgi:hypothetical protein